MKRNCTLLIFFLMLTLAPLSVDANSFKIPIISEINADISNFNQVFVSGYTQAGTKALIYLDGNFIGEGTKISSNGQDDKFEFRIDFLPTHGDHELFAIAEGINSPGLSPQTKQYKLFINTKIKQPEVLNIKQVGSNTFRIEGISKNNTRINIYVDDSFIKSSDVLSGNAESNYFSTDIDMNLGDGRHLVRVYSSDLAGRTSLYSEAKSFDKVIFDTSPTADTVKTPTDSNEYTTSPARRNIIPAQKIVEANDHSDVVNEEIKKDENVLVNGVESIEDKDSLDILDVLNNSAKDNLVASSADLSDEANSKQSKFSWNLLIFAGFLIAVILWIIWVNKELIKERQSEEENESEEKFE